MDDENEKTPTLLRHPALNLDEDIRRNQAAGAAAARASTAASIAAAVRNASKPGSRSSEFKVAIAAAVMPALTATLQAAFDGMPWAALFGPFALPAAWIGSGLLAGLYALSRASVKKQAIDQGRDLLRPTPTTTD